MSCPECHAPDDKPHATKCSRGQAETQTSAVATTGQATVRAALSEVGLEIGSYGDLWTIAESIAASELVPKSFRGKPADCMIAMAFGKELGFSPFMALQSFVVINGKLSVPGETALALIQGHPDCESYTYDWDGEGDDFRAWVVSKRRGRSEAYPPATFSIEDARQAGLYDEGKTDKFGDPVVWTKYTKDMLFWKAVARDARRNWPDVLRRAPIAEDQPGWADDEPRREVNITPATPLEPAGDAAPVADPARALFDGEQAREAPAQRPEPREPDEVLPVSEKPPEKPPQEPKSGHRLRCAGCEKLIRSNHEPTWAEGKPYHAKCAPPSEPAVEGDEGSEEPPPEEQPAEAAQAAPQPAAPESSSEPSEAPPASEPSEPPPSPASAPPGAGDPPERGFGEVLTIDPIQEQEILAAARERVKAWPDWTDVARERGYEILVYAIRLKGGHKGSDGNLVPLKSVADLDRTKYEAALSFAKTAKIDLNEGKAYA